MPVSALTGLVEELQTAVFETRNILDRVTREVRDLGARLDDIAGDTRQIATLTGQFDRLGREVRDRLAGADAMLGEIHGRVGDMVAQIEQVHSQMRAWFALPWWQRLFKVIDFTAPPG